MKRNNINNMISNLEQKTKLLIEFRDQMVSFFDEIIEQFPKEGDFVIIRIFLKDRLPVEQIMKRFINNVLPCKQQIKKRDEKFFLNDINLYSDASKTYGSEKVNYFKKLWTTGSLDKEDKIIIWKWIDLFVLLSERYKNKFIK